MTVKDLGGMQDGNHNFSNWIIYVTVKAAQFEYEIGYILVTE